jgi:predicted LPLAT superfamily acyltransferase
MIEVHATEGFGMAELFLASAIVEKGDVVLMAGDRGGGRVRTVAFAGVEHRFPEGAFRLARHLERNVYFAASVLEDGGYRVFVKRLPVEDMFGAYIGVLEDLVKKYPDQWYQWEGESAENG